MGPAEWISLPTCEWPDGWWNFRAARVVGRDSYGNRKMIERALDARNYRRRLRKVKQ